jgi:hypothetical protein
LSKKSNGYGKGTFVETRMFLSKAWLSLGKPGTSIAVSSASTKILIAFLLKRRFVRSKHKKRGKTMVRSDDNRFTMTYKELTSPPFSFTQPAVTRAIDELLAKGFINILHRGGAFEKDKTIFELVDDWQNWKPGDPPIRERAKDVKRGFQGKRLGGNSPSVPQVENDSKVEFFPVSKTIIN